MFLKEHKEHLEKIKKKTKETVEAHGEKASFEEMLINEVSSIALGPLYMEAIGNLSKVSRDKFYEDMASNDDYEIDYDFLVAYASRVYETLCNMCVVLGMDIDDLKAITHYNLISRNKIFEQCKDEFVEPKSKRRFFGQIQPENKLKTDE